MEVSGGNELQDKSATTFAKKANEYFPSRSVDKFKDDFNSAFQAINLTA